MELSCLRVESEREKGEKKKRKRDEYSCQIESEEIKNEGSCL